MRYHHLICLCLIPLLSHCSQTQTPASSPSAAQVPIQPGEESLRTGYIPAGLVYLDEVVPGIKVDLKYCGNDNFVGRPIDGYTEGKRAILRHDMAACVKRAQELLAPKGLGLLVWDAYRPHRAMEDFNRWSMTPDVSMKNTFYPNISKQDIYKHKYIRQISEHSWGVAVDVTLIDLATGKELDMGGRHDLLDESSATRYAGLTPEQQANRLLLRDTMDKAGMRNYRKEWWHYFIKNKTNLILYDFPLCDTMKYRTNAPRP